MLFMRVYIQSDPRGYRQNCSTTPAGGEREKGRDREGKVTDDVRSGT